MNVALRPVTILSICSGVGMFDRALHEAIPNSRTIVYVEREAYAAAVVVSRIQDQGLDDAPIWSDLATFDALPWRGVVDIVAGGIPCQPFSVAGKRRGIDDERWIWSDVLRIIRDAGPRLVILENVPEFVRHGLPTVLQDLAALGFDAAWRVVSAASVGASHKRDRVFVVAYCNGGGFAELRDGQRDQRHDLDRCGGEDANVADSRCPSDATEQHVSERWRDSTANDCVGRGAMAHTESVLREGQQRIEPDRDVRRMANPTSGRIRLGEAPRESGLTALASRDVGDTDGIDVPRTSDGRNDELANGSRALTEPDRSIRALEFAPGPSDPRWRDIIDRNPGLAPAIEPDVRFVAHGLGPRVDQLRAAGNGVVPQQAAAAIRKLMEDLGA